MAKKQRRLFSGMGYRDVQRSNANRRSKLSKQQQQQLKKQGYKNVGWDAVIRLYQKINDLISQANPKEETLEELFLKADRIGNKYQTAEEIASFNQQLSSAVAKVSDLIDQQFPDEEYEFVDYSSKRKK